MLKEMIYLRLVQGIGDLVCEGCCDDPDCGLDPKECSRILEAVEMLASFDIGKERRPGMIEKCNADNNGVCMAMICYSDQECGSRNEHGCPNYCSSIKSKFFIDYWKKESEAMDESL